MNGTTPRFTQAYLNLFSELSNNEIYKTFSVAEFYCDRGGKPDLGKINVVIRIDVDNGLHLCVPLGQQLKAFRVNATYYFLTHPERYYQIWGSGVPSNIQSLGFEVGLHSDHYYEELIEGKNGLQKLKSDIERLSEEAGTKIRGMVHHGHPAIDEMGRSNWELTKNIHPQHLGLEYNDGLLSCYIQPGSNFWHPKCDIRISDFMGFPHSWGWNYYPRYPLKQLKKARPGDIVHITLHAKNAFRYWESWDESYGEMSIAREGQLSILRKAISIRMRYGLLKSRSLKYNLMTMLFNSVLLFLARGVGFFWPTPGADDMDISWESGRQRIYQLGIGYWRKQIELLGIEAPGGRVLDVGSGNGQWLLAYAQDSAEVIGVEPDERIREFSIKKIAEWAERARVVKVVASQAENLPFRDNYFDQVLCAGVFMFTNQDEALKEMSRVLKPGGRMCLTVNGLGYFLMYILNGFRYKSVSKMNYGVRGVTATLLKWCFMKKINQPKAVNPSEMKEWLRRYGLSLHSARIYLQQNLYPKKHLGFPTNYAFLATKNLN